MNISQAAHACGLPNKTIRFYEEIGLVVPERQASNSYRIYSMHHVERLRFLQRARAVGFSLDECRQLLDIYVNPELRGKEISAVLERHLDTLGQQMIALNAMRESLESMIKERGVNAGSLAVKSGSELSPRMAFTLVDPGV